MKRDWNQIKLVLEDVEKDRLEHRLTSFSEDGTDDEAKYFGHLWLLEEGGFIRGISVNYREDGEWYYSLSSPRLTFAGHDLLDAIRSETIWSAVKKRAKEAMVPITLELIKTVVTKMS